MNDKHGGTFWVSHVKLAARSLWVHLGGPSGAGWGGPFFFLWRTLSDTAEADIFSLLQI